MKTLLNSKKAPLLVVCLTALLFVGCSVSHDEIQQAIELCKQNEGLDYIAVSGTGPGTDTFICRNGARFGQE